MIESVTAPLQSPSHAPRRDSQSGSGSTPGFSYALAAASLEKRAAQSLETYGAKPESATISPVSEAAQQAQGGDTPTKIAPSAEKAGYAHPSQNAEAQQLAAPPAGAHPKTDSTPAPAAAPSAVASVSPNGSSIQPQSKTPEAAALKENAARDRSANTKAPRLADPAPELKKPFAEILAKRLDGKSLFDLRLDPPDLGRIEGRLSIADDGQAILSLTFDNQGAFDLFSRDEQALRLALQQAGLTFANADFNFTFRQRTSETGDLRDEFIAPSEVQRGIYDPEFLASWSAGALDMRI